MPASREGLLGMQSQEVCWGQRSQSTAGPGHEGETEVRACEQGPSGHIIYAKAARVLTCGSGKPQEGSDGIHSSERPP